MQLFFVVLFAAWLSLGVFIGWIAHRDNLGRPIYLPVKECVVLRTQCKADGVCGTLETYNCEDIQK